MSQVLRPKPRRAGLSNFNTSFPALVLSDDAESKPVAELLGPTHLTLIPNDFQTDRYAKLSSSPPFIFGSPPCRAHNPLVNDACFGIEKLSFKRVSPKESAHTKEHFGKKQVGVRVEGFDCSTARAVALAYIESLNN
ncbi:hypothetical protein CASFOL_023324 [Castilleja foliolosa]|uniref:Uncharacterized protein n=1 Tax=Castilleja foliolosa TaxID=1961234 RepID=A0ABD3CNN4_9LAMI